jgi:serine/threonine protein phosphatase 1
MNPSDVIYAVGDIHGSYNKLVALMEKIPIDYENDTLVFIGDYIDRGPNSYEVIEYLLELKNKYPDIVFLKGNHEEMLEKYLVGRSRMDYLLNGGQQTLESYVNNRGNRSDQPIPETHLHFFQTLLPYYETDEYIFVHAGLREKVPLEQQAPEDLFWIRDRFLKSRYDYGKTVVFGHTPFDKPIVMENKIGIDTGATYGNRLTCVRLPDLTFYSA